MNRLPFFSFPFAPFYHVVVTTRNNFESETQEELWGHDSYFTRNVANRPYLENDNAYIPILMRTRHANLDIRWSFLFDADLVSWKLSCHRNHRPRQNHRPLPPFNDEIVSSKTSYSKKGATLFTLATLIIATILFIRARFLESEVARRLQTDKRASPPGLLPR